MDQPLRELAVEPPEGRPGRCLIRLVAGDQGSESVGREDLGRVEVTRRECGLAGTGGADQHDKARVRDHDLGHESLDAWLDYDAARRTSKPPASAARISYAGWS